MRVSVITATVLLSGGLGYGFARMNRAEASSDASTQPRAAAPAAAVPAPPRTRKRMSQPRAQEPAPGEARNTRASRDDSDSLGEPESDEGPVLDESNLDEPPRNSQETLEAAKLEEAAELERWYGELDQRFETQGVEGSFSRHMGGVLKDALSAIDAGRIAVASVDCRSDMCKTKLTHDESPLGSAFLTAFMTTTPTGVEHHFQHNFGETVIYSIQQKKN
jgi:hypothetical protein